MFLGRHIARAATMALALMLILLSTTPMRGQQRPTAAIVHPARGHQQEMKVNVQHVDAVQLQQASNHTYLPLIQKAPDISIHFGANVDAEDNLIGETKLLAYGASFFYYQFWVDGAKGQSVVAHWVINGQPVTDLDEGYTISFDSSVYTNYICMANTNTGDCTGNPLPAGTYTVSLVVGNNAPVVETLIIQ